jgi:hypothetical protein
MEKTVLGFTWAAALALGLVGCAAQGPPADSSDVAGTASWAEDMAQAEKEAVSPEVKAALSDGQISDQEYAEMKERYVRCLAAAGITLTTYGFEGGQYTLGPAMSPDEGHRQESRCSAESGEYPIGYFYLQMRVNPNHEDMAQQIVDCYKREGLVGKDYAVKDYVAGDFPRGQGQARAVTACDTDPQGRLRG